MAPSPRRTPPDSDDIHAFAHYHACVALATGREDACAGAAGLMAQAGDQRPPQPLDGECGLLVRDYRFWHAAFNGDPDAEALCLRKFRESRPQERFFRDDVLPLVCAAVIARGRDPKRACEAAARHAADRYDVAACIEDHRTYLGGGCSGYDAPTQRWTCEQFGPYDAARRSGSSAACRGAGICRVLMVEGKSACEPLLDRLRARYRLSCRKDGASDG